MEGKRMIAAGTNRPEQLVKFLRRLGLAKCGKVNLEKAKIEIIRRENGLYYVKPK